jgi:hypothetical protein
MTKSRSAPLPATLVLLAAALPAKAQDHTGWGVGAGGGASTIEDLDGDDEFKGDAIGYAVDFECRFTPNFALGGGGFSLGRDDDDFGGFPSRQDSCRLDRIRMVRGSEVTRWPDTARRSRSGQWPGSCRRRVLP